MAGIEFIVLQAILSKVLKHISQQQCIRLEIQILVFTHCPDLKGLRYLHQSRYYRNQLWMEAFYH